MAQKDADVSQNNQDSFPIDINELKSKPTKEEVAAHKLQKQQEKQKKKEERHQKRLQSKNPFIRFGLLLKRTANEISMITWPSARQLWRTTLITIIVVVIAAAFILGMDAGSQHLVSWLYSMRP